MNWVVTSSRCGAQMWGSFCASVFFVFLLFELFTAMTACNLFCITAIYCSSCLYSLLILNAKCVGEKCLSLEREEG